MLSALDRWPMLIIATGAAQLVEDMITDRAKSARNELGEIRIDESVRAALANMAAVCTEARRMSQMSFRSVR